MADALPTLLLTPDEMAAADRAAAVSGIDSFGLMERAGQAVAAAALRLHPATLRFVVFCGPGNNGGDGYVAAGALSASGARVEIFHLGDPERLKGDAATARARVAAKSLPLDQYQAETGDVIIDALFGAGLSKPVPEDVKAVIDTVTARALPVVAVDLPSGLCGRTGMVRGAAFQASHTVTFMALKPGHLLLPGRALCGPTEIFDIGIPHRILSACAGQIRRNDPSLWQLPVPGPESHKFRRGHLGVFSGGATTSGAARLSARAGLKAGAGLVTLGVPPDAAAVVASHLTAIMVKVLADLKAVADWIADRRLSAFVLGPGFGSGETIRSLVELIAGRPLVLDADGISAWRDRPQALFSLYAAMEAPTMVLTPHEGEFARLFPDLAADPGPGKVEKAQAAAARARAVIVCKGADTVIAAPDGRARINTNAPPWLATAGSGDVLAGLIGGLMAQGMPAFDAASAGVFLHGKAGERAGPGLTAEDLPEHLYPLP